MTAFVLTPAISNLPYQAKQIADGAALFVKNAVIAYELIGSSCNEITDIDYPSYHTYSLTTLTSVGTTATATTSITNSLVTGMSVTIAGASPSAYNGTYTITVTGPTTFTYVFAGGTSPATGTKTAVGGQATVPGVVFLDNYVFVQATTGEIYNSTVLDCTTWNALSFITPEKEPDCAVAIAKSLNYLCAFKQWDTEFFYDAAIASPASPLATVDSSYLKLGCATAQSIIEFDGGIIFMSQRDGNQRSREIHVLNGLTPKKISTPEVERLLNGSNLNTCYTLYLSTAGHQFYFLTLKDLGVTAVYDFNNGVWSLATLLTPQSPQSISAGNLTSSNGVATCTLTAHGFSDGDPVAIIGAAQSQYTGTFNITYVDANTFTYPITGSPTSPATGTITAMGWTESYFAFVSYAQYQNLDLVLAETSGLIYSLQANTFNDDGSPIDMFMQPPLWDNGNNLRKDVISLRLVGDKVADVNALIRYSDDDSQTFSNYKKIDLEEESASMWKLGQTRRRAYNVRFTEDAFVRFETLEQEFLQGR